MEWRRFRLLNERELRLAGEALGRALAPWAEAWMHTPNLGEVRCIIACDARRTTLFRESDHWLDARETDAPLAWICVPDSQRAGLARNLFGERTSHGEGKSALLPAVADAALRALLELLAAQGGDGAVDRPAPSVSQPTREVWTRGSGAIVCELRIGEGVLGIVLAESWVRRALAPFKQARRRMPTPSDPRLGLESLSVRLAVWAGSAEVELGLLQSLAPGDVVKVDLAVDRPMRVSVEGSDSGRRVFLGRVGDRKAVVFVPPQ